MSAQATRRATLAACDGVSVVYGDGPARVVALDAVDLRITPGERVALWGRSGSGKTTLLHVLGGLVTPTAGSVSWHGRPLSSLDAAARGRARAEGIAYVFQGANLLPSFTAFENVAFALRASGHIGGDRDPAGLLELVGLSAKLDALPSELSGGEAQRVAIARAAALRRADRPPGLRHGHPGAGPRRRAPGRVRIRARPGDARCRRRRARRPHGHAARRPRRRRGGGTMTARHCPPMAPVDCRRGCSR
jgi:ABC-type lipoprotein export system ATPase subunit